MNKPRIEFKQLAPDSPLDLYIYEQVMPNGYDWRSGAEIISETSADYFRDKLAEYPTAKQINLYINSPGGSVMEGYGIYSQLKRHPANVTAFIDGFACSVASVIAMSADHVVMYRNSMMMIHNAADGVWGNATQLRKAADTLDKLMEGNRQVYLAKANGKLDEPTLIKLLDDESYLTAQDCIGYGLADEISNQEIDQEKAMAVMKQATNTLQQQINAHKALQRIAIEMQQQSVPPTTPQPEPEPPKANKPEQLFKSLFN